MLPIGHAVNFTGGYINMEELDNYSGDEKIHDKDDDENIKL